MKGMWFRYIIKSGNIRLKQIRSLFSRFDKPVIDRSTDSDLN